MGEIISVIVYHTDINQSFRSQLLKISIVSMMEFFGFYN